MTSQSNSTSHALPPNSNINLYNTTRNTMGYEIVFGEGATVRFNVIPGHTARLFTGNMHGEVTVNIKDAFVDLVGSPPEIDGKE